MREVGYFSRMHLTVVVEAQQRRRGTRLVQAAEQDMACSTAACNNNSDNTLPYAFLLQASARMVGCAVMW